jgi:cytochrome o ubiquinol oxidase subunit 1
VLHNSLFLIAHFHNVIIGGVVFGCLAAMTFWFPKVFGFTLNEFWGKVAFWCWLIGFYLAFMPLYALGLHGHDAPHEPLQQPDWQPYLIVALVGACIIGAGILAILWQLFVSVRDRNQNRDLTGDPWDGRSLEWATASPAPFYNFAHVPNITSLEQHWDDKDTGRACAARQVRGHPYAAQYLGRLPGLRVRPGVLLRLCLAHLVDGRLRPGRDDLHVHRPRL